MSTWSRLFFCAGAFSAAETRSRLDGSSSTRSAILSTGPSAVLTSWKPVAGRTAVSEITQRLWAEYEAFASRDLSELVRSTARLTARKRFRGLARRAPEKRFHMPARPLLGPFSTDW